MHSGIKTTHPDGTTYEYTPVYEWIKLWGHKWSDWKIWKEGACIITYHDGRQTMTFNSDYDHIAPLKPGPNDIF
jgi:hypothetical protein